MESSHKSTWIFSLCAQAPRQASYVLFTPKMLDVKTAMTETRRDWEISDMAEKRFYRLSDSFIIDNMSPSEEYKFGYYKKTLAADGGLIYAIYHGSGREVPGRHIVCNPVSKDFHQIRELKPFCKYDGDNIVVMLMDNATKSYRILTMESYDITRSRRTPVFMYDSTTTQWRKLCDVPGVEYRAHSSIFMKGVYYTLFVYSYVARCCPKLYSCDIETGAWSYIDVKLSPPSSRRDNLQLVVSLGRLFYVEYSGLASSILHISEIMHAEEGNEIKLRIKVSIWEILFAKKEVIKVAKMSKSLKVSREILEARPQTVLGDHVVAVGCADSIVISSLAHRVAFDLSKNSWHEMPENTEHMHVHGTIQNRHGICAGLVHLDLREMSH